MKRFLVRAFQILCFIQILGYGQLHAHTIEASRHYITPNQTTEAADNLAGKIHHQPIQHLKYSSTNALAAEVLVLEDVENDEDENEDEKKLIDTIRCYQSAFQFVLYPHNLIRKSTLYFSEEIPFNTDNRKYILYQVFRI